MMLIGFSILFAYVTYFIGGNTAKETCQEPWSLQRETSEPVFVRFNNETIPGKYVILSWHWSGVKQKGEWETTLCRYDNTDTIMGSMTFRESGKVENSLIWKYDETKQLSWIARRNKLLDFNWTLKSCNVIWKFGTNDTGDWELNLGDYELKGLVGTINNVDELLPKKTKQFIKYNRTKRFLGRFSNKNHTANNDDRGWQIVREILDRVFGSSDTLREEGWISHITNLLYLAVSALSGAANPSDNSARSTSTFTSTQRRDVETFDPNIFARKNNSGKIISARG